MMYHTFFVVGLHIPLSRLYTRYLSPDNITVSGISPLRRLKYILNDVLPERSYDNFGENGTLF